MNTKAVIAAIVVVAVVAVAAAVVLTQGTPEPQHDGPVRAVECGYFEHASDVEERIEAYGVKNVHGAIHDDAVALFYEILEGEYDVDFQVVGPDGFYYSETHSVTHGKGVHTCGFCADDIGHKVMPGDYTFLLTSNGEFLLKQVVTVGEPEDPVGEVIPLCHGYYRYAANAVALAGSFGMDIEDLAYDEMMVLIHDIIGCPEPLDYTILGPWQYHHYEGDDMAYEDGTHGWFIGYDETGQKFSPGEYLLIAYEGDRLVDIQTVTYGVDYPVVKVLDFSYHPTANGAKEAMAKYGYATDQDVGPKTMMIIFQSGDCGSDAVLDLYGPNGFHQSEAVLPYNGLHCAWFSAEDIGAQYATGDYMFTITCKGMVIAKMSIHLNNDDPYNEGLILPDGIVYDWNAGILSADRSVTWHVHDELKPMYDDKEELYIGYDHGPSKTLKLDTGIYTITVDGQSFLLTVGGVIEKELSWEYRYGDKKYDVSVSYGIDVGELRDITMENRKWNDRSDYAFADLPRFVHVDEVTQDIVDQMRVIYEREGLGSTDQEFIDFIISLPQVAIQYPSFPKKDGDYRIWGQAEYWQDTMETLYFGIGDCEDTSAVACSLLKTAGFKVAMCGVPGHVVAGVVIEGFVAHTPEELDAVNMGSFVEATGGAVMDPDDPTVYHGVETTKNDQWFAGYLKSGTASAIGEPTRFWGMGGFYPVEDDQ